MNRARTVTYPVCVLFPLFSPSPLSEDPALARRNSTSATLWAAGKCTGRRRTCEHTCAGTRGSDLLSAAGCFAARGSHAATSCRDTGEHTQVPPSSSCSPPRSRTGKASAKCVNLCPARRVTQWRPLLDSSRPLMWFRARSRQLVKRLSLHQGVSNEVELNKRT